MSEKNQKKVTNLKYKAEHADLLIAYVNESLANEKKPTLFEFMRRIGVYDRKTLSRWKDEHKEFGRAYDFYMEASRSVIVEKALSGAFDASFSKFLLSCDYGMKEKTQVDVGNPDGEAFKVDIKVID